jgi:hypothetical protein
MENEGIINMKPHKRHAEMKKRCNYNECKYCPNFLMFNENPKCMHNSEYTLDCRLLFPLPAGSGNSERE